MYNIDIIEIQNNTLHEQVCWSGFYFYYFYLLLLLAAAALEEGVCLTSARFNTKNTTYFAIFSSFFFPFPKRLQKNKSPDECFQDSFWRVKNKLQ